MSLTSLTRQKIHQTLDRASHSPEYLARLAIVYSTLVALVLPDLLALSLMILEIFEPGDGGVLPINLLFKGAVLLFVFAFGTIIINVVTRDDPGLRAVLVLIGLILIAQGGVLLGYMANRCIPDLACNPTRFTVGLVIATGVTWLGYLIPLAARRYTPWLGIIYLAVGVWISELWLVKAFSSPGIEPSGGAMQGLILLGAAILWVVVFARMPNREEPERPGINLRR